jgi:hypothetical protein
VTTPAQAPDTNSKQATGSAIVHSTSGLHETRRTLTLVGGLIIITMIASQNPLKNFSPVGKLLQASNTFPVALKISDAPNVAAVDTNLLPSSGAEGLGSKTTNMIGSPSTKPQVVATLNTLVFNMSGFKKINPQPFTVATATKGKEARFDLYSKSEVVDGKKKEQRVLVPSGSIKNNSTGTSYLVLTMVQGSTNILIQPYGEMSKYTLLLSVTDGNQDLIFSHFLGTIDQSTNKPQEPVINIGTTSLPLINLSFGEVKEIKLVK